MKTIKIEFVILIFMRVCLMAMGQFDGILTNQIVRIWARNFGTCISCTKIDLSSRHIEVIHVDSFNGLSKAKILYLLSNQIEALDDAVFDVLVNLEILDLSHNRLETINARLLAKLVILKKLYLHVSF